MALYDIIIPIKGIIGEDISSKEFKRKMNYFVSTAEFKHKKKNPFIAALLSIFLGVFGGHRFYLRRKVTGVAFLVLSIFSLNAGEGNLALILLLLTVIEGVIYTVRGLTLLGEQIKSKIIKRYAGREGLTIDKEEPKIELEKTSEQNEETQINDIEIIEISNIEPTEIPTEGELTDIFKPNWIKRLNIPYERGVMRVPQVREQTLSLYETLCNLIDAQLRHNMNSLSREVKRIGRKGEYYNDILYTIYCISEGHITKGYSGSYIHYDPTFSYGLLGKHLGKDLKDRVFIAGEEWEKALPFPDSRTRAYFYLTENGLPFMVWDEDGRFRSEREFSEEELNILKLTPIRNTKPWKVYEIKRQIIEIYLKIWEAIASSLKEDLKWDNDKKIILEGIRGGEWPNLGYEGNDIPMALIRISENAIREVVPNLQVLDIGWEEAIIRRSLPRELIEEIDRLVEECKVQITEQDLKCIIRDMLESGYSNWKFKADDILLQDEDGKIDRLIAYGEDEDFVKIAKKIISSTKDEELLLLCLYGIELEEQLSQQNVKLLEGIIHPSNISIYKDIVQLKENLSLSVLDKLLELREPVRKTIELDMDKVKDSKRQLAKTVDIVNDYIGEEDEVKEVVIQEETQEELQKELSEEKDNDKLELKYGKFLKVISDSGAICVEEGKRIAIANGTLLNAFVSDVNQELYEYIQDQTIVIEDDYIKIDDFYVDIVKELLINAKSS